MNARTHLQLTPGKARRSEESLYHSSSLLASQAGAERASCPRLDDGDLDQEHATLFALIERLLEVDASDTLFVHLEAVRDHAQQHFAAEDVDLRHMSAGNTECHLAEHAAVLRSLAEVRDVLLEATIPAEEIVALVRRLASQLVQWLPVHVQEMDGAVAMHRSNVRFGGATIRVVRTKRDQT